MAISPQRLTIYLYSAHRTVIFAIAQLSCTSCARPVQAINCLQPADYRGGVSWVAVNWRAGALRRPPTSSGCG